jgi:hypothetical protein
MPTDPRKRQKKQERRAAKRKEKRHLQVREQNQGLADRLTAAAKFPVLHSWISDTVETEGIGSVVLSRELPDGRVAVATFLVDRFCLGVKDAFAMVLGRATYNEKYTRGMRSQMPMRDVPPADVRKLVEDAVAYARSVGIAPHADYARAALIFGPIDASQSTARFEFGQNGKPHFIAGPHDSPERCRQIIAILSNTCGPDRFNFTIPLAGPEIDRYLPAHLEGKEPRLIGPYEEDDEDEEDVPEKG